MTASVRAIVAASAVALLVGCGGGGGGSDDASGDDGTDPIAEFLGFDELDGEEGQQRYLAEERERQGFIAECMAEQGFTYVPVEPDQGGTTSSFPGEGLSPAEFAEELGYGMSTTFEESFTPPEGAEEYVDPNAATVEAFSDTERQAWEEALYGTPEEQPGEPVVGEDGEVTVEAEGGAFFGAGCEGDASEAVYGDNQEQFEEFNGLFEDYQERLESDRRYVDAEASWRECMAERGFEFDEVQDASDSVNTRMEEIWSATDPMAGMSPEEIEALTPEEMDALFTDASQTEPDPELLAEIQAYELEVAGADFACAEPIRAATNDVAQDFLDEHREEFEQYRDLIQEQNGVG